MSFISKISFVLFFLIFTSSLPCFTTHCFAEELDDLIEAIEKKLDSEVIAIIRKSKNPEKLLGRKFTNKRNVPSLILAIQNWLNFETLKYMIKRGAEVNSKDYYGRTPIMEAAQRGQTEVVELLIDSFIHHNNDQVNKEKNPEKGPTTIAELFKETDSEGNTSLTLAVAKGHVATTKLLIRKGADVNERSGTYGITPLMVAVWEGHVAVAELLINNGARVNMKAYHNPDNNPLENAIQSGHLEMVRLLITKEPLLVDGRGLGFIPLVTAAHYGRIAIAELLIQAGAQMNIRDRLNRTPLMTALRSKQIEFVKYLLTKTAYYTQADQNEDIKTLILNEFSEIFNKFYKEWNKDNKSMTIFEILIEYVHHPENSTRVELRKNITWDLIQKARSEDTWFVEYLPVLLKKIYTGFNLESKVRAMASSIYPKGVDDIINEYLGSYELEDDIDDLFILSLARLPSRTDLDKLDKIKKIISKNIVNTFTKEEIDFVGTCLISYNSMWPIDENKSFKKYMHLTFDLSTPKGENTALQIKNTFKSIHERCLSEKKSYENILNFIMKLKLNLSPEDYLNASNNLLSELTTILNTPLLDGFHRDKLFNNIILFVVYHLEQDDHRLVLRNSEKNQDLLKLIENLYLIRKEMYTEEKTNQKINTDTKPDTSFDIKESVEQRE